MSKDQKKALEWLRERGGDAVLDRNGAVIAAGETAPHTRSTWNALATAGRVEFYNPTGRSYGRIRIVERPR